MEGKYTHEREQYKLSIRRGDTTIHILERNNDRMEIHTRELPRYYNASALSLSLYPEVL